MKCYSKGLRPYIYKLGVLLISMSGGPSFLFQTTNSWRRQKRANPDHSGESDAPNFHDSEELNGDQQPRTRPRRAPYDETPTDDPQDCFPCQFVAEDNDDDPALGAQDRTRAFAKLKDLVLEHHGANAQIGDLITLVETHYDEHIKRDYGNVPWARESIYRWIMDWATDSEERQALEGIKLAWRQVELLRQHVADEHVETGDVTPNLKVQKALNDALKLHSTLVTERKRRIAANPTGGQTR